MGSEHPLEEQELHRVDRGEQGLTAQEKEVIALRNRVLELTNCLEALSNRVERIVAGEIHWNPDHACADCVPWSDCLKPGFQCGRHTALRLLREDGRV